MSLAVASKNGTAVPGAPNLYQRIVAITGELGAIERDGQAPDAMGGFRFISHAALMGHLRARLAHHGVAVLESLEIVTDEVVTIQTRQGSRSARRIVVKLAAEFVNADQPEDRFPLTWFGEGVDSADKALQKAATSAEKYLLFKVFKVSDREDPDGAEVDGAVAGDQSSGRQEALQARHQGLPTLSHEQRQRLSELVEQLPEELRPLPEERWRLARAGFEEAERVLLSLLAERETELQMQDGGC